MLFSASPNVAPVETTVATILYIEDFNCNYFYLRLFMLEETSGFGLYDKFARNLLTKR